MTQQYHLITSRRVEYPPAVVDDALRRFWRECGAQETAHPDVRFLPRQGMYLSWAQSEGTVTHVLSWSNQETAVALTIGPAPGGTVIALSRPHDDRRVDAMMRQLLSAFVTQVLPTMALIVGLTEAKTV